MEDHDSRAALRHFYFKAVKIGLVFSFCISLFPVSVVFAKHASVVHTKHASAVTAKHPPVARVEHTTAEFPPLASVAPSESSPAVLGKPWREKFPLVLTVAAGATWITGWQNHSYSVAGVPDGSINVTNNQTSAVDAVIGVGVGLEIPFAVGAQALAWQPGLAYQYMTPVTAEGNVSLTAGGTAPFTESYQYHIQSQQLLFMNKLSWMKYSTLRPFVSVGLGMAMNAASSYQSTITFNGGDQPAYMFPDNTTYNLTYQVGAGVDYKITPAVWLGLSYLFQDLGAANLGAANYEHTNVQVGQTHVYAQGIKANLVIYLY